MIELFVSDLQDKAQRCAVIVRAPVPRGEIAAVRLPSLPEGYAFYTAEQLPACKTIDVLNYALPLFALGAIDYKNQAVGILVGDDPVLLVTLRESITIVLESNAEQCSGAAHDLSDYPVIAQELCTSGDSEACFAHAAATVSSSFSHASQYSPRSEPFSVVTVFREDGLDVYVPTQWPFHVRTAVSRVTGLAEEAIVVHPTNTGETCNELLWYPSLLACRCAAAAMIERKSLSLYLSAEEGCEAAPKTPAVIIEHSSALSDTFEITALNIAVTVNAGAACPLIGSVLKHMALCALGPYTVQNYQIDVRAVNTGEGLVDIFEGWGDYYVSNALENHLSKIIQVYNLAPIEYRMQHIRREKAACFSNLFRLLAKKSDFTRKYAAYHAFNCGERDKRDGVWRGIGIAGGFHYTGCPIDFTYTVSLTLDIRNRLIVRAEPTGQDVQDVIKNRAIKKLKINEADIIFEGTTTEDMNISGPATSHAAVNAVLPLVEQALTDLQEQRFRTPLPISISCSTPIPQHGEKISEPECSGRVDADPIACVVELEMDIVCYELHIRKLLFVGTGGKAYGRKRMLSTLRKHIVAALSRTTQSTNSFSLSSDSSRSYRVYYPLQAKDVAPLSVDIFEQEDDAEADASGAGVPDVLNILPAAYLAALNQILLRIPSRIEELPICTEHIFKALTGKRDYENSISSK